jgi:prevent-host-death family protein
VYSRWPGAEPKGAQAACSHRQPSESRGRPSGSLLDDLAGQVDQVNLVDQLYTGGMEVTVQEAKTQLSRLLRRVEAGEDVVIRRGREPVAMLVRVPARSGKRAIWGDLEGSISADFDEVPSDLDSYA